MLNDGIPCSKNDRIPIGDIYLNFVNVSMIPNNIITPIDAPIITFGDSFVREIKLIILKLLVIQLLVLILQNIRYMEKYGLYIKSNRNIFENVTPLKF